MLAFGRDEIYTSVELPFCTKFL